MTGLTKYGPAHAKKDVPVSLQNGVFGRFFVNHRLMNPECESSSKKAETSHKIHVGLKVRDRPSGHASYEYGYSLTRHLRYVQFGRSEFTMRKYMQLLWMHICNTKTRSEVGHGDCVAAKNGYQEDGGLRVHLCSNPNEPENAVDTCVT